MASFREQLTDAVCRAYEELQQRIGGEDLYAFALFTSGQDAFSYVCASANTEEKLAGRESLRWSPCDWEYHDFSDEVGRLAVPGDGDGEHDKDVYEDMVAALKALKVGRKTKKLILCGDMGDEFFLRGMRRLSSAAAVKKFVEARPVEQFFAKHEASLPAYLALWTQLVLEPHANEEAQRAGVTSYDVEPRIAALGAQAVPGLIEIAKAFAFATAFTEPDSEERKRRGAMTAEADLATSAVFLIADIGRITEPEIAQLQALLAQRVQADASLSKTWTLAENIARVLHTLQPKRFPASVLDSHTNRLRNPEPFLPQS